MAGGFDGYELSQATVGEVSLRVRVGGDGPPLLLLHGYPETHLMWAGLAAELAQQFTVVAPDLRGYGDSSQPPTVPSHETYGKRAMAADGVALMRQLGFDRFDVAGHDRGGRVAYRMALDSPDAVRRLTVMDVIPTSEVWARADARMALGYWHWAFLAQPAPLPERLIAADPDAFFDFHVRALGLGRATGRYPAELMEAYRGLLDDAGTVKAICEDYRAGAGVDRDHDDADRGRRYVECPLLVLWGAHGALPRFYGDVLDVWQPWARRVTGQGIGGSHFLVEDRPEQVADLLSDFMRRSLTAAPSIPARSIPSGR